VNFLLILLYEQALGVKVSVPSVFFYLQVVVMESSFLMLCCSKADPASGVNLQKRNKRKNLLLSKREHVSIRHVKRAVEAV
jgi:hypothetical protein